MATHREAVAVHVRRIIAAEFGRSLGGTSEFMGFEGEQELREGSVREIEYQIAMQLGVEIPLQQFHSFSNVGDVVNFVETAIRREYGNRD